MGLLGFEELRREADAECPAVRVIAVGGADPTVLIALNEAQQRGWVTPLLSGVKNEIEQVADSCNVSLNAFTIIDCTDPAAAAVAEIRAGRASMLMKGQIATPDLMKAVLHQERGLRTGKTLCQIVLMEIVRDQRRFLMGDTGLCIEPDFRQKREILEHEIAAARCLGVDHPAIAVMSATEKVTSAMPDTEEAAEFQRLCEAGEFGSARVQGPLSFDLAYARDAGDRKRIAGSVVGEANGMLFPDLLSGNLTVKGIMYTADCRFGGVVWGAAAPIVFMSRADQVETRLNSLVYALRCRNLWSEFQP